MNNYIIFTIFLIIYISYYIYANKESLEEVTQSLQTESEVSQYDDTYSEEDIKILKKINKRKVTMDDLIKADEYALKKICALKNYGYDKQLNTCTHITEKTCIEDHPGTIANAEDIEKMEKIRQTGCAPQLEAFTENVMKINVGEWYKPNKEDLDTLKKEQENVDKLKKIWEKNGRKEDHAKYLKADAKLQIAERNGKASCRIPDHMFKDYCRKENLYYQPHRSGIGSCSITPEYCKSKLMNYDSKKKQCNPKDKVAEFIFGKTVTRGLQNLDKVSSCPQQCKKDAWCAGLNICKPITNPGQSCWSRKHQSCWCQSKCFTPMNKQAAIATATAVGTVLAVAVTYIAAAATCAAATTGTAGAGAATCGPIFIAAQAAATGIGVMAVTAGATATAALSLEAGRCSAGKDGLTLVGGVNGSKHYIHIHEPGCNAAYSCPDHPDNSYYCPGGIYPTCKPARKPGDDCITGIHNWCKGHSKCLPVVRPLAIAGAIAGTIAVTVATAGAGTSAAAAYSAAAITLAGKCSAGKDGINQVGKIYKYVPKLKKGNENPAITDILKKFDKIRSENFPNDESFAKMDRPPKFEKPMNKIEIADNGTKHYMKLGLSGCGAAMPCRPDYYCPVGAGPCKKAQPPGNSCIIGLDNWCRGQSKCLGCSRCSAGADGINVPGDLYFKDDQMKDIIKPGYIYFESTNKKVWDEPRALIYTNHGGKSNKGYMHIDRPGCGLGSPTPSGYYCKNVFESPKKAKKPGQSCLFGNDKQCIGNSKCVATVTGEKCSAGPDGINPPGKLTTHDLTDNGIIYRYWPEGSNKKLKLRVRLSWLYPPKILSEQDNRHFIALNTTGCSAVASCPDKVKSVNEYGENEITHTWCKNGFLSCKLSKSPGRACTHFAGMGNIECKQRRCKGGTCSAKIGQQWYVPIDGRCGESVYDLGLLAMKTDECEPDTYCKKGSNGFGNCTFGVG